MRILIVTTFVNDHHYQATHLHLLVLQSLKLPHHCLAPQSSTCTYFLHHRAQAFPFPSAKPRPHYMPPPPLYYFFPTRSTTRLTAAQAYLIWQLQALVWKADTFRQREGCP